MTEYRYLSHDLRTGDRLGELPLGGVSYSERLNRAGDLTATIDLSTKSALGTVRSISDDALTEDPPGSGLYMSAGLPGFIFTEDPPGSGLYIATTSSLPSGVKSATLEEISPGLYAVSIVSVNPPRRLSSSYLDATVPRRTVIWVQRDDRLMDGYIVWGRATTNHGRTLTLRCASLWSYFGQRRLTVDKQYPTTDQLTIAQDLVTWAQSRPGGDIGVVVPASTSGVLRDRLPLAWRYERKVIGTLVEQLAEVTDGFDFAITADFVADVPTATFRCYYPRRGRRAMDLSIVFRAGHNGNVLDYTHDEDGIRGLTTLYGIGAGEGTDMLLNTRSDTSLLDQGYPLQEDTLSHKDVSVMDTLDGHVEAELGRRAQTPVTWKLLVDPDDASVPFGSWTLGDDVRLIVDDDDRFPAGTNGEPGFDGALRIMAQTVTVPDDGGPDVVALEMGAAYG